MRRLAARAPGKVNLCLYVGRPRAEDGLHPLASVVQPVSLADTVALEAAEGDADEVLCPAVPGENLAARALAAFRDATGWDGPPVRITIAKRVPVAGGMGGGSSDAAATLRLMAAASGLPIPADLPMRLGADVPVLLHAGRALMTGAGERVQPLSVPARDTRLVIVPVDAELPTSAVYRACDELGNARPAHELIALAANLRDRGEPPAVNDLQEAAISLCPAIVPVLDAVAQHGPALVSGSGPTVFARVADARAGADGGAEARAESAAAALRAAGLSRAVAATPVDPAFAAVRPA